MIYESNENNHEQNSVILDILLLVYILDGYAIIEQSKKW